LTPPDICDIMKKNNREREPIMPNAVKIYVEEHIEEVFRIIRELCRIPAPSHAEQERAAYCQRWFAENGMPKAYIDEAFNVILPYEARDSHTLTVLAAHTDTVFPDTEPMPYDEDDACIRSPGVGDDTAGVAVLMLCAKYFFTYRPKTQGVLFVCNTGEEGLGNLKGARTLFADYGKRIRRFITLDTVSLADVTDRCVGSHRYRVEVQTEGGHSFRAFGKRNAICELARIVNEIYRIELPEKENARVTYNVGSIEGGTSVNTIAQKASMLCEYRSDDESLLAFMQREFERIFKQAESDDVHVSVARIGERPCAKGVCDEDVDALRRIIAETAKEVTGQAIVCTSGSTDCNIPLSMGIPAIAIGAVNVHGAHTREEWIEKPSLPLGLELAIRSALRFSE